MDTKDAEAEKGKAEADAKAKADKAEAEKALKTKHDARFTGTSASSVIEQIKAYGAQAKVNKQKEVATVEEYKDLLWEVLKSPNQVKV